MSACVCVCVVCACVSLTLFLRDRGLCPPCAPRESLIAIGQGAYGGYPRAVGHYANLNAVGGVLQGFTPVGDRVPCEKNTYLAYLFLFVLVVWCA